MEVEDSEEDETRHFACHNADRTRFKHPLSWRHCLITRIVPLSAAQSIPVLEIHNKLASSHLH
jgi:hypothetical protein